MAQGPSRAERSFFAGVLERTAAVGIAQDGMNRVPEVAGAQEKPADSSFHHLIEKVDQKGPPMDLGQHLGRVRQNRS
jgi:hypothetical protein